MTFLWKSGSFTAMCRKNEKYIAYPGAGKLLHRDFLAKKQREMESAILLKIAGAFCDFF